MMRGLLGDAAHAHAAFVNQRLHVRAAHVRKLRGEKTVQALAGVLFGDHEFMVTERIVWRVEIVVSVGVRIIVHEGIRWFCFALQRATALSGSAAGRAGSNRRLRRAPSSPAESAPYPAGRATTGTRR